MRVKIANAVNENLDVLIEEPTSPKATVVMAHGIGTNKHETDGMFDDVAAVLLENKFRVIRFDYAGFGESEGSSEDFDLEKAGQDLAVVIDYARTHFEAEEVYLLAQSMSTAITARLLPHGIAKTVFTAHVNPYDLVSGIQARIRSRQGGIVDENGISIFPRSNGSVQKYGASLWKTLRQTHFLQGVKDYAKLTKLLIIRPKQDDIVVLTDDKLVELRNDPTFTYKEIVGDHSFRGKQSRDELYAAILAHFQ